MFIACTRSLQLSWIADEGVANVRIERISAGDFHNWVNSPAGHIHGEVNRGAPALRLFQHLTEAGLTLKVEDECFTPESWRASGGVLMMVHPYLGEGRLPDDESIIKWLLGYDVDFVKVTLA